MRRLLLLLVGLLVLVGVAAASSGGATQAQPRWVITDLGVPSGYASSDAVAVNDRAKSSCRHARLPDRLGRARPSASSGRREGPSAWRRWEDMTAVPPRSTTTARSSARA